MDTVYIRVRRLPTAMQITGLNKMYEFKRHILLNERTDSDLIVAKLFVLTRNDCVALPYPT